MVKIVYNDCYGGFGLSEEATALYLKRGGDPMAPESFDWWAWRKDPILVEMVEEGKASGEFSDLAIADIPEGSEYRIDEYDGMERVMLKTDYVWQTA